MDRTQSGAHTGTIIQRQQFQRSCLAHMWVDTSTDVSPVAECFKSPLEKATT